MRIAFLSYEFPGARPGGVGSYTLKAAQGLAQAGHEPHIFTLTLPPDVRTRLPAGVMVHEVEDLAERIVRGQLAGSAGAAVLTGGPGLYKLAVGWLLCEKLRQVHAATPFAIVEAAEYEALALPLMLRPAPGLPVVTQIHLGSAVNRWANDQPPTPDDELIDALEFAAILGADGVCAATRAVLRDTARFLPLPPNTEVLPHGIPAPATHDPQPTIDDQRLTTHENIAPILFVGRLQRRKGCCELAEAANLFLRRCPDAVLHIVGSDTPTAPADAPEPSRLAGPLDGPRPSGSMQAWMERRLAPDLRPRFIFKGELGPAQVAQEYAHCSFAVVPSRVENFANTAADALSAGRTLVYAGGTGTEEVVADAGLKVEPLTAPALAAALEQLWRNPPLRQQLAARAAAQIQRFDTRAMAQARVAFFEKVRAASPRSHGGTERSEKILDAWTQLPPRSLARAISALALLAGACVAAPAAWGDTPGTRVRRILQNLHNVPGEVWIFGAGRFSLRLLAERAVFEPEGSGARGQGPEGRKQLAGFIDDSPWWAHDATHLGLPVVSRAALEAEIHAGRQVAGVILATDTFGEKFWDLTAGLRALGVPVFRLDIN